MGEELYSYIFKGELTKVALDKTQSLKKHSSSEFLVKEVMDKLPMELLDDELILRAKKMSTVYVAIAAFENTLRSFVVKILMENFKENWWEESVSAKIRTKAESRKLEEEKIKWHTNRGDNNIYYTELGDLVSIIAQNQELFEPYILSNEWARQIIVSIERSRNVIMHSGELSNHDIERIGTLMRDWINQIGA